MNTNLDLPDSGRRGDLVAVSRRNELPKADESGRQELKPVAMLLRGVLSLPVIVTMPLIYSGFNLEREL